MSKKFKKEVVKGSFLSTGIIAQYCDTTTVQVSRWIKNGDIKAFRTPGGQYRITQNEFRDFLERIGMPIIEDFFRGENKKKILIADDDETVVGVISDILQEKYDDISLKTAYDGYQALITAGNFNPDLMILDIRMPKIDGLEVCRRIRENEAISSELKILAITAHVDMYDRTSVIDAGADEYLIKPIDIETLLSNVRKLI